MYKCDKCNNLTNVNIDDNIISIEGKSYIKKDNFITQILCENCLDELKDVKWTEHIGKELIKEISLELTDHFGTITKRKYKSCLECDESIEDICDICKVDSIDNTKI